MLYSEKLQLQEWHAKRDQILARDDYTCKRCKTYDCSKGWIQVDDIENNTFELYHYDKVFNQFIKSGPEIGTVTYDIPHGTYLVMPILNVHHKHYIVGREPWDYDDEVLETLCIVCHMKLHLEEDVFVYNASGEKVKTKVCSRCGGRGSISEYQHVQNGICFKCWGEGIEISVLD